MNNLICTSCGTVDNIFATKQTSDGLQCSRCLTGDWHGLFAERKFDATVDRAVEFINPPNDYNPTDGLTPSV